jgi:hypothetical protein
VHRTLSWKFNIFGKNVKGNVVDFEFGDPRWRPVQNKKEEVFCCSRAGGLSLLMARGFVWSF